MLALGFIDDDHADSVLIWPIARVRFRHERAGSPGRGATSTSSDEAIYWSAMLPRGSAHLGKVGPLGLLC